MDDLLLLGRTVGLVALGSAGFTALGVENFPETAGAGEPLLAIGVAALVLLVLESSYVPLLKRFHTDSRRRADERADGTVAET